jgi:hypothetical protein
VISVPLRRSAVACTVAAALGVLAGAGALAQAAGTGQQKSTLSTYYLEAGISIGDSANVAANCQPGEFAVAGGYQLQGGNFMWVLATGPLKDGRGWFVTGLVPNKIAAPGVLPARVKVKAVCAEKGKAIVP